MRQKKSILVGFLFIVLGALNAYASPVLQFRNKKFKIIQFTDLHYISAEKYKEKNDSTLALMRTLIEEEKPDLVIITGDVVVSAPAVKAWKEVVKPMTDLKVPFAVTFGNHDVETDCTKNEIVELLDEYPLSLTRNDDASLPGEGNCALPVKSSDGAKDCWVLYLFDSQAYSGNKHVKGYDWIKFEQIQWYRETRELYSKDRNTTIPALAFFHIPLPEFEVAGKGSETLGNKHEYVYPSNINSGLFASFVEENDVKGVFVGHAHNNDFVGLLNGILLGHGRKTGYVSAYHELLERGGRVIELFEDNTKFNTYIRTLTGKYFEYTYPF
uniref:metallophosphoesterase family protein n=1 Tax=uncultured Draconibacterium sp. TaxID=1573823 RepID=UPI0032178E28